MKRLLFTALIVTLLVAGTANTAPAAAPAAAMFNAVRISQLFGGGGGSGYYLYDYVELFNAGADPAVLTGWSLQYGPAAGNFASSASNLFIFPAGTTIQPGRYLLIQTGSAGSSGAPLPLAPDLATPTTGFFLSQSSGKVALANVSVTLGCGATATPCVLPDPRIVDLVAYGAANNAEGGRPVGGAVLTNQQGVVRKGHGCQDTGVNRDDFDIVNRPAPRNSASPAFACPANSPSEPKCPAASITPIGQIQSSGTASPIIGKTVTIFGRVVSDLQSATSFKGFHVQDAGDGDPLTSDGIFVYAPAALDVVVGDVVEVTGVVTEHVSVTELNSVSAVRLCSDAPAITPTPILLPEAVNGDLERYEGMLVTFPQTLTADQNYFLGRYGQITLSSGGRLFNPTNGNGLGDTADLDARRVIVLDDGLLAENPAPTPYIGADNTHRAGDTITGLTGVVDYGPINANSPPTLDYRLQPTAPVVFTRANPRSVAPAPVGGNVRIASANVLNYFTTLDPNSRTAGAGFICGPRRNLECRGADSAAELIRQRTKLLAELLALDADVVGLTEIENTDNAALADLTQGLNDALGAETYAYVVAPASGADAIKVALLYKPGAVIPAGPPINYQTSHPTYGAALFERPPLAQTFKLNANGERFSVVVNHFKSKSGCPATPADPNLDYGQGCWNAKRVAQANALLGFIATLQQSDPDVLVIGDLNAYGQEDPINTLTAGGLTNEIAAHVPAATRYTYVFDGLAGYLDQALATPTLDRRVTGVTIWHNNTDEPSVIDYNLEFKPQDLYAPTPYRASDHDPVLVGLNLAPHTDLAANQPAVADPGGRPAATASLGGRVWYDGNGNGVQDAGEPGAREVTVALLTAGDAPGALIATAVTGADGDFRFDNVAAGSYLVEVTDQRGILAGLTLVSGAQSRFNPFGSVEVNEGDVFERADFGYTFATASDHGLVGDRVWLDANRNRVQDAGEDGLAGVQICARPLVFGARVCALTNADGVYGLSVPTGIYLVTVVAPAGLIPTTARRFVPVVVFSGVRILSIDLGYSR